MNILKASVLMACFFFPLSLQPRTLIIHFSNHTDEYVVISSGFLTNNNVGPLYLPGRWQIHTLQFNIDDALFEDNVVSYKLYEPAAEQEIEFQLQPLADPLILSYRYQLNDAGECGLSISEVA